MKQHKNQCERIIIGLSFLLFFTNSNVFSQSLENLNLLEGNLIKTYYSDGSQDQAVSMASRCEKVMSFYKSSLSFEPKVILLVLSPVDWSSYTTFPVYGMPHYDDKETLIVASEDNEFWQSFIPPLDQLPKDLAGAIFNAYSDRNNELSMRGFFDLLAIHELGHAYHIQGKLTMQRNWMGELFSNIFLHTYVAEMEPNLLPALTVFPKMVVSSTNKEELKFTTLNDLETNYSLIGQQFPNNYGWYQSRWHMAAGNIYDDGGILVIQNLWQILKTQKEKLDDSEFAKLLSMKVHQSVADVQLKWDE